MPQEKIRVILVDDNIEFCNTVLEYLKLQEDIEVIATEHNGIEAYEKIKAMKPDVAILDGAMPELDGLGILEKLNGDTFRPVCIMLSTLHHERVMQYAYSLGAEYYIIKPFDMDTLAQRIRMFGKIKISPTPKAEENNNSEHPKHFSTNLEQRITSMLHEIGVPIHVRGYHYLRSAILISIENPDFLFYITKELYPAVAKKCNSTPGSIERSIRNAINVTWNRGNQEILKKYFTNAGIDTVEKPTNSEFIAFFAERLRFEKII